MNLALDVFLFSLVFINTLIHSIGAFLLIILHKQERKSVQKIYFIKLSILEIFLNLMEVLKRIPEMLSHRDNIGDVLKHIQHYATVTNLTGIWVARYLTMIYITFDRFLMVRLALRYQMYWTRKKAKYLITATCVFCLSIPLIICTSEVFLDFHYQPVFYKYVFPIIDFGYIVLSISVYTYIFYRHQKSYKMEYRYTKRSLKRRKLSSTADAFVDSRFYTTVLLVMTFILFIIIPDLTYMFIGLKPIHFFHDGNTMQSNQSNIFFDLCRCSYAISSTIDFFIYIFGKPTVQAILCGKCHQASFRMNKKNRSRSNTQTSMELVHFDSKCRAFQGKISMEC